jgi:MFS family permease
MAEGRNTPTGPVRDGRLARTMAAFALFAVVEYAIWVAVLLYAYARGGAGLVALVNVAQLLPAAVLAPPLGSLGDRLPRGTALCSAYAAEAVTLGIVGLALLLAAPVAVVVVAAAAATTTISVARPIHYAAVPQLATTPRVLVSANAAAGVSDGVGGFAGPVIAGIITQGVGPWLVAVLCSAAMLAAAMLTVRLRLPVSNVGEDDAGVFREAVAGLRRVSGDRPVLALLCVVGVSFLVAGSLEVLSVSFSHAVLAGGDSAAGLLVGATGMGALLGSAAAAGLAFRQRLGMSVVLGLLASGVPLLALAAVSGLPTAVAVLAICGLGGAFASVAGNTLLQRSTDGSLLARVFAIQEGVMLVGMAAGAALAPLLIDRVGAGQGYVILGVGLIVIALAAWPSVRHLDVQAVFRADVVAAIRRVGFLAAMSPPSLDRLSQAAQWMDVTGGDVVIRQGDSGDAFFVVDQGRLSVAVDGVTRVHTLGPGNGFGEIALLRDVPRTATVTALEPCRLLRVERADFLAAVTGSADGLLIAEQVAASHLDRDTRLSEG